MITDEMRQREKELHAELMDALERVEGARQSLRVAEVYLMQSVNDAERIRDAIAMHTVRMRAAEYCGAPYMPNGWGKAGGR